MTGEVITRPNGKRYRPRKGLRQVGWTVTDPEDDYVAVLGTHDIEKARVFVDPFVCEYAVEPRREWVREMIRDGEPCFTFDPFRGAAAVVFRESDDPEEGEE